ncbi:MAG: transposase domain-containing protein [Odoribacter splanchnicus]
MSATNKKQAEQNEKLQERIKELTAQVAWLNHQLFGRKAEKLPVYAPNIFDLFANEFAGLQRQAEEKRDEAVEKIEKESAEAKKQKRQNCKIVKDLPVLETKVMEPIGVDLSLYRRIGEEVTKVVKHKLGMLYVKKSSIPNMRSRTIHSFLPRDRKEWRLFPYH